MAKLFGRFARIQIGVPGQPGRLIESLSTDKDGNIVQGLHFTFKIEKNSEPTPNKCQIDIYNLNDDTIELLHKKGAVIVLEAGYGGILSKDTTSELIFKGDVFKSKTTKKGPDYITTIENGDGLAAFQTSNFEGSFAPGTGLPGIIDSVISSFEGLGKGEVSGVDGQVLNGATLSGSSKDIMNQLAGKTGTEWSIQNGLIQMVPVNKFTKLDPIDLVSIPEFDGDEPVNTGLINSPTLSGFNSSKEKKFQGVEFTSLLQPGLTPGRRVRIRSMFVPEGVYVVKKVTHNGDTRSGPWHSECEAVV